MHKYNEDDLFKDSTMTFGEHLEALRIALFKAVLGLAIGCGIGLMVGDSVVAFIERPLRNALIDYYTSTTDERYTKLSTQLKLYGIDLPWTAEEIGTFAADPSHPPMTYDLRLIDPQQLSGQPAVPGEVKPGLALPAQMRPLLLWQPTSADNRVSITTLSVTEGFSIWVKASLVFGVIVSSPWVFYHIWQFVAAGLYPHEKRYVHVFLPFSLGLFLAGAALAYVFVFSPVLDFLFGFNEWLGLDPDPRISEWLGFVLLLPLGFGISFQLPLVMLFLERIGVFNAAAYIEKWRISILVIFVLSAVLTPADPYSMLLMAVPLTALYGGGILLCKYLPRNSRQ